jgi:hypothetical protein
MAAVSKAPKGPRRECRKCGRVIGETPSGHLRAHQCPHGKLCVATYFARRGMAGHGPERCDACEYARNLTLPGVL